MCYELMMVGHVCLYLSVTFDIISSVSIFVYLSNLYEFTCVLIFKKKLPIITTVIVREGEMNVIENLIKNDT